MAAVTTVAIALNDSVDSFPPAQVMVLMKIGAENPQGGVHTFQNSGIPRLDRQCGNVRDDLRSSLKNNEKNADGATDSFEGQAVVEEGSE